MAGLMVHDDPVNLCTPEALAVLRRALRIALAGGHDRIDAEHIALAVARRRPDDTQPFLVEPPAA